MNEYGVEGRVIPILDAMRQAWEAGVENYTPAFRDEMMEEECGDVGVSLRNLRAIVRSRAKVCCMHARPNGVLVSFCGGLSYLATGFQVGRAAEKPKLLGLARFAAEIGLGDAEKIAWFFGAFPPDYEGELEFPVPGDLSLVK